VAALATGYVYYVSLKGVTGAGHLDVEDVSKRVEQIKKHVKVPVGVGFGIRDGETARAVAQVSDAVVIGSRLVEEIEQSDVTNIVKNVEGFIRSIRKAID
jgi:tryptophan synthase alpha chain